MCNDAQQGIEIRPIVGEELAVWERAIARGFLRPHVAPATQWREWTITGASNTAPAAADGEQLAEQPMPDLPGGGKAQVAEIEQALLTALAASEQKGAVVRAVRYSTRPAPPGFRYGATIDFTDGWRLFATCVLWGWSAA
ncbi:hypothetical protein ACFYST_28835 [Kitasatospora sp. NPDC004614]|uniref:hypothetical protein n=1 Tax=unclassified Kitasatospora TaxID=2633591 RepID=UPI0036794334